MVFEEIRYVDTFPRTFSLNNGVEVDLESMDILGVNDFRIYDSLLILSTGDKEGLWSFLSLPDYRYLGKFLTLGQGPYEFYENPDIGQVKFFKKNGELFAGIYHFHKGKIYEMNIDESFKNNRLCIETVRDSLPLEIFNFVMIDSSTFFCKELSSRETQQIRYMSVNGERITPSHFERLNLAKIREHEDYNILSTGTKYDSKNKFIVEMPAHLNYINMYSIDGSFQKTICIGKRLDNMDEIQDKNLRDRMDTFSDLRLFSRFWGVVFTNEMSHNWRERTRFSSILLFDWNGDPLAQLNLNNFSQVFDIDVVNGRLYTLDYMSDVFYKYDIREILEKL
jgi:hypothetical protein